MVVLTRASKRRMLEGDGGRASQEDEDLISLLPELLPTADAAPTQLLARRWRPLWRSSPLNLEARVVAGSEKEAETSGFVSRTLSAHRCPARRFSLHWDDRGYGLFPALDSWLHLPLLGGLHELELFYNPIGAGCPLLEPSAFRCSATLRVLTLCSSFEVLQFPPAETLSTLYFPCIKQLTLMNVRIAENSLNGILSRCPVLESLLLFSNIGYRRLRISSPTLRSLGVSDSFKKEENNLEELIVDSAPLLERLIPRQVSGDMVIRVIQAPRLKVLGFLPERISTFQLGSIVIQKMMPLSLSTVARTMKILALHTNHDLSVVISFLKCFPCVETLYIEPESQANIKNMQSSGQLECLDLHLKKLVLTCYTGTEPEVNFVKFFASHAKVLESLKIMTCGISPNSDMHKELHLESRASRGAEIVFESATMFHGMVHNNHIHDMATEDPFDLSSCRCDNLGWCLDRPL